MDRLSLGTPIALAPVTDVPRLVLASQSPARLRTLMAAGIAMGYTILRRATRQWRTFGIVATVLAAEFVVLSLPLFVSQILQARGTSLIGPLDLIAYFSVVFAIGAAALVLYLTAAGRVTPTESS